MKFMEGLTMFNEKDKELLKAFLKSENWEPMRSKIAKDTGRNVGVVGTFYNKNKEVLLHEIKLMEVEQMLEDKND